MIFLKKHGLLEISLAATRSLFFSGKHSSLALARSGKHSPSLSAARSRFRFGVYTVLRPLLLESLLVLLLPLVVLVVVVVVCCGYSCSFYTSTTTTAAATTITATTTTTTTTATKLLQCVSKKHPRCF